MVPPCSYSGVCPDIQLILIIIITTVTLDENYSVHSLDKGCSHYLSFIYNSGNVLVASGKQARNGVMEQGDSIADTHGCLNLLDEIS